MGYDDLKVIEAKKFLVAVTVASVVTPRSTTPIMWQRPSRPPPQPNSVRGSRSRRLRIDIRRRLATPATAD
jgi:hypothetical protein